MRRAQLAPLVGDMAARLPCRIRPRLARTLSRGRWHEYRRFLRARARNTATASSRSRSGSGTRRGNDAGPTLILRHDVDQHPRSALAMAAIEEELGVRSSWYFRWRTAHPLVVSTLGLQRPRCGLHYETLTRNALELGGSQPVDDLLLERSRRELRAEIETFDRLFGPSQVRGPARRLPAYPRFTTVNCCEDGDCRGFGDRVRWERGDERAATSGTG